MARTAQETPSEEGRRADSAGAERRAQRPPPANGVAPTASDARRGVASPHVGRGRRAITRALRFVSLVLIQAGLLLLADVAVTLAWQEPISAVLAAREQDELGDELDRLVVGYEQTPPSTRPRPRGFRPAPGGPVGRIELPTLGRDYVMVEGTDPATLRKGPGRFPETALPGQRRTVAVAGHRTTYLAPFRTIDDLERGEPIVLEMPYGRFTYRVERQRIVSPQALWVTRDVDYERLVLTACHPLYSAEQRIVVFARLAAAEARRPQP